MKTKVLLLITGSIAAVKIPLLVSQLVKNNFEIKCVVSKNAEKLIQPLSLSILSRNACILDNTFFRSVFTLYILCISWSIPSIAKYTDNLLPAILPSLCHHFVERKLPFVLIIMYAFVKELRRHGKNK